VAKSPAKATPLMRRWLDASGGKKWGIFGAFVVTSFAAAFMWFPLEAVVQQNHNIAAAAATLKALKSQDATLQQQIDHLSTKEGFDQVAREQYQLVPQGQSLYLILPPASAPVETNGGPVAYPGDPGYQPVVSPSAGSTSVSSATAAGSTPSDSSPSSSSSTTTSTDPATPAQPGFFSRLLSNLEFWK